MKEDFNKEKFEYSNACYFSTFNLVLKSVIDRKQ